LELPNFSAVGIIGRIEPFEDTVETWTSYTERLEQYFEVKDIAEDKKVPALLTLLGGKTYTLLRNLTAPNSRQFYVWSLISIESTIHFKYVFNTD
jgi:hypothetical protein